MKYLPLNLTLCATLLGAVPVGAHSAKPSAPVKALHGGQSLAAGPYHLELVAKDGELLLYVTDHSDKAIPTDGAKAHGLRPRELQPDLRISVQSTPKLDDLVEARARGREERRVGRHGRGHASPRRARRIWSAWSWLCSA